MRDEEPPLPPPSPVPPGLPAPSRLRRTLHTLRTPFRPGSPFHIGLIKRTGSSKSVASDGEIGRDERTMRKRNKKQREPASDASRSTDSSPSVDKKKKDGGSFMRRMGSFGKKKAGDSPQPPSQSQTTDSQPTTAESTIDQPLTPPPEPEPPTPEQPATEPAAVEPVSPVVVPVSPIAVEHPVATRPFSKSAWKRSSEPEMEKPVEDPSPENALRRRIAFVAQASACLSEDHDDGERGAAEVGSLEEAVALARSRLAVPASPSPAQSHDADTEEEGYSDAMPAYGDLIEPDGPGTDAPVSVLRRALSDRRVSERCARAMTFEEAGDDSYFTVCECCGFSAETAVFVPVRYTFHDSLQRSRGDALREYELLARVRFALPCVCGAVFVQVHALSSCCNRRLFISV